MNNNVVIERTIDIYLQVAETAHSTRHAVIADSMLSAAYDQINLSTQSVEPKTLTRLGELLTLQNSTIKSEEIFNRALKKARESNCDDWLLARIYDGLAEVYIRQSKLKNARKRCEQAIRILGKLTASDANIMSSRKRRLALINLLDGRCDEAENLLK